MENLRDFFERWEFELDGASYLENTETGEMTNLTWSKGGIAYSITSPHKGNDFKYLFRANPIKTFDKWGNADIERYFDNIEMLANFVMDSYNNKWIERDLLDIYIDRYIESCGE